MLRAEDVCQTMTAAFPSTHSSLLGILVSIKGKNRLYIQISYFENILIKGVIRVWETSRNIKVQETTKASVVPRDK